MSGRQKIGGALTVFGLALSLFAGVAEAKPVRHYYVRPEGTDFNPGLARTYATAYKTLEGIRWEAEADGATDALVFLCGAGGDSTRGSASYSGSLKWENLPTGTGRFYVVSAPWYYGGHDPATSGHRIEVTLDGGVRRSRTSLAGFGFPNGVTIGDGFFALGRVYADTVRQSHISSGLYFLNADSSGVVDCTGDLTHIGYPHDPGVINDNIITGCTFLDIKSENSGTAGIMVQGMGHCNQASGCADPREPNSTELCYRNKIEFCKLRITNNQAQGGGKPMAVYNSPDFRVAYTTIEINVNALDGYNEACAAYLRDFSTNIQWNRDTVLITAPQCAASGAGFRFMFHASGAWPRSSAGTRGDSSLFHAGRGGRFMIQDWAQRDTFTYCTFVSDDWPALDISGMYHGATVLDHCTLVSNTTGNGGTERAGVLSFSSNATADADTGGFQLTNSIIAHMKNPPVVGAAVPPDYTAGVFMGWNNSEVERVYRARNNLYWVPSYRTVEHDRDIVWRTPLAAWANSPAGDGPILIERLTTGTAARLQPVIPFTNTGGLYPGMHVTAAGVAADSIPTRGTILSISNNVSITMSANLKGAVASGSRLYFNDHWFEDVFPRRDSVGVRGYPHFDNGGADTVISATAPCLLCPYAPTPGPRDSVFGARVGVFSAAIGKDEAGATIGAVAFVGQPFARISRESWQFVCHESAPETLTTTITNAGNANLVITNLAATNGAIFASFLDGTTIAAGASSTLRMILNCPGPFQEVERVTFATNDTRAPLVTLDLYKYTGPAGGGPREIEP